MPANYTDKDISWRSFPNLKNTKFSMDCIIDGDFNATIHSLEKMGGSVVSDPSRKKLEELIVDQDLLDIKPIKGKYTWTNKISIRGHIAVRLDIFLVHSNLLMQNQAFKFKIFPSITLDHNPFLFISRNLLTMSLCLLNLIYFG